MAGTSATSIAIMLSDVLCNQKQMMNKFLEMEQKMDFLLQTQEGNNNPTGHKATELHTATATELPPTTPTINPYKHCFTPQALPVKK
jgi:hypothetical protein